MNGFLRNLKQLGTSGLLIATVAISAGAATAVAESGPGSNGYTPSSDNSGPGNSNQVGHHHKGKWWKKRRKNKPKNEPGQGQGQEPGKGQAPAKPDTPRKGEDNSGEGKSTLPVPAKPDQGETFNLQPNGTKGTVTVKVPGSHTAVALTRGASVPVGSVIDARKGKVTLTTVPREDGAKQWAAFSGAMFKMLQPKTGLPVTEIRLRGGDFSNCARPFAGPSIFGRVFASKRRARKGGRSLWGRGKGRFRTRGRHGAATVRGTIWQTKDTCAGTLVRVRRGVVDVRDFAKKKTVAVHKGERYLARAPKRRR